VTITSGPKSPFVSAQAKLVSRVGTDVMAYCGVCKMNLTHTIVTVGKNQKPDRVQCNTCKAEKQYRAPKTKGELAKIIDPKLELNKDGEVELDLEAGGRFLIEEGGLKKKSKAKAKSKKKDDVSVASKSGVTLPLSMQAPAPEDIASYEARLSAHKNNLSGVKDYKSSSVFKPSDVINHKVFGLGFVVLENGPTKIEVLFAKGRKLLVNNTK